MKKTIVIVLTLIAYSALTVTSAWSQEYPTRSIRWIVLFPPGGGSDLISRLTAEKMAASLG